MSNPNRGEHVVKSGSLTCEQLCTTDWAVGKAQVRRGAEGGKGEEWKAVGHCHWIHASTHSLARPLCQTHIFNVQERLEMVKRWGEKKVCVGKKPIIWEQIYFTWLLHFQLCKVLLRHSGLGRQDLVWTVFKLSAESNFWAVACFESESSGIRNLLRKHHSFSKANFVGVFVIIQLSWVWLLISWNKSKPFLHIVKCFPLLCEGLRVCLKCLASDSSD